MTDDFIQRGWLAHPVITSEEADKLADIVRLEALYTVFHDVWPILEKMSASGLNPTQLLTNNKLRKEWLDDPKMVWRNGNSRAPLISASCGMVNIYCQPDIREYILFNPSVIETIRRLYTALTSKEEKLVYALGPDRLGLKAKGARHMNRHCDSNMFLPAEPQHRVQAFVTLRCATPTGSLAATDIGSIEVLEGFHHYTEIAAWFFAKQGVRQFTGNGPYDFEEITKKHLTSFTDWVRDFIYGQRSEAEKHAELQPLLKKLPAKYVPIQWVAPVLKPGELFCFDTRLPHRNTQNKSEIDRIVAYVSLYRHSYFERIGSPEVLPMFRGEAESKHKGSNRKNPEERELFAKTWEQRVNFDLTRPLVREVLGLPELSSTIKHPE